MRRLGSSEARVVLVLNREARALLEEPVHEDGFSGRERLFAFEFFETVFLRVVLDDAQMPVHGEVENCGSEGRGVVTHLSDKTRGGGGIALRGFITRVEHAGLRIATDSDPRDKKPKDAPDECKTQAKQREVVAYKVEESIGVRRFGDDPLGESDNDGKTFVDAERRAGFEFSA